MYQKNVRNFSKAFIVHFKQPMWSGERKHTEISVKKQEQVFSNSIFSKLARPTYFKTYIIGKRKVSAFQRCMALVWYIFFHIIPPALIGEWFGLFIVQRHLTKNNSDDVKPNREWMSELQNIFTTARKQDEGTEIRQTV